MCVVSRSGAHGLGRGPGSVIDPWRCRAARRGRVGSLLPEWSPGQTNDRGDERMRKRSVATWGAIPVVAVLALAAARPGVPASAPQPVDSVDPATYVIDTVHSELSFRIRHLIGRVAGGWTEGGGTLRVAASGVAGGSVVVTIETASINTLDGQGDAQVRSPDFFAADRFPAMTYRSNRVEVDGDR